MNSVATVAFCFMSPEAIRVFLQLAGYRVSIFDGSPESLDLRLDRPDANVVLLPNFAKRDLLAPHAERIGRLVVLANGRHETLVEHDIPILDGDVDGDSIRQAQDRSPHFYTKKIKEAAAPLELTPISKKVEAAPPPKEPNTLDRWFDILDGVLPESTNFDRDVEYPVCQYLIGQINRKEFRGALKVLVGTGADEETLRAFYTWLTQKSDSMAEAMRAYLLPSLEQESMTAIEAANKYNVDPTDIALLESIYLEMKKPNAEGDVDE